MATTTRGIITTKQSYDNIYPLQQSVNCFTTAEPNYIKFGKRVEIRVPNILAKFQLSQPPFALPKVQSQLTKPLSNMLFHKSNPLTS